MPNTNSDTLMHLIKSLQRSEKRHFKLFVSRLSPSTTPLYLELYNFLDKTGKYVEEDILRNITGLKKSQLANVKANLFKQLMTSLRLLHRDNSIDQQIREQLDFAHILYSKRLYRASLQILEKAKKKAMEYEMHPLAIEIISFEKRIESQHITHSVETRSEFLARTSEKLLSQYSRENRFSSLSILLYGLYLQGGLAGNDEDVKRIAAFYDEHVPDYEEHDLSFYEKLYLYQSNVWVSRMTHDFVRHFRFAQKWVDLFHQDENMLKVNMPLYLKGLHNLLYSLFRAMKYRQFVAQLNHLTHFNDDGKYQMDYNEEAVHHLFIYIHRINRHFLEGSFTEALNWLPDLEHILSDNKYNWDIHRVMVFYYSIACLYFGSGNNDRAIEFLNKIINNPQRDIRQDIQSYARILNLIAHFELGNDVLVGYQLKSVYRFLAKQEELNQVNRAIVTFLRRTPSMQRYFIRDEFEKLLVQLKQIEQLPYERRSFLYLDIISWLESKVENKDVEEVMQEKFRKSVS